MTTEEKLKQLILSQYRSVREFTQKYDIPYSTMATIWKKGIKQTSITTMIKVCQALGISTDELIAGRITFVDEKPEPTKVEDIIVQTKHLLLNTECLTLGDKPCDEATLQRLTNYLDVLVDAEKRNLK